MIKSECLEQMALKDKELALSKLNEKHIQSELEKVKNELYLSSIKWQEQNEGLQKTKEENEAAMSLIRESSSKSLAEIQELRDTMNDLRKQN